MFNTGYSSILSAEMNTDRSKGAKLTKGWILDVEGKMGGPGAGGAMRVCFQ